MPYCSVEEAWGKNFKNLTKPPKKITPPKPNIEKYKIEEGMVGAADTGAYASFNIGDSGKNRKQRYNTNVEPLEFQRGMGVKRLDTNTGGPVTDSFIEDLYFAEDNKQEQSQYSLLNSASANVVVSDGHLQNQYRKYIEYIGRLEKRIEQLELELEREKNRTSNSGLYNIIIYIVSGIFIIFLLDCFVRLGKCIGNGGLGGSLKLKETPYIPDIRNMVRRPMFRGGNSGFVPNRFYYN